ncbi:MAG: hypothetical protein EBS79_07850 [Gammaproteobacteria bacterium]|nr:hypothetical protein [Gammaproteobacteria bacterium]
MYEHDDKERGNKLMNNDPDEWSQKLAAARNSQVPYGFQDDGDGERASPTTSNKGASYSVADSIVRWIDRYLEGRVNRPAP